jgi:hypothetical protein
MKRTARILVLVLGVCLIIWAQTATREVRATTGGLPPITTVFIILEENHNWSQITASNAPYIRNVLVPAGAHAEQYYNPPSNHPSLPNYLWLEAGSNLGITDDNPPSINHRSTTMHLVTYLNNAGISWKAYEEGIDGSTCPLSGVGKYAAKHDPFVYFDDVTNTNDPNSAYCIAHVRPYGELAGDLTNNTVAHFNFITPDLCHDMHDCSPTAGDNWLSAEVPKILNSDAYKNGGALFITWDEAATGDGPIGMVVLSPFAKVNYSNSIQYSHSSTLRTLQEIFNVAPFLRDAANATDLRDLFKPTAAPIVQLSTTNLNFGNQPQGSSSSPQAVTLKNSGNATLTIGGTALTGANNTDFSQTNDCGSSVAAGSGCAFNVTFTPSTAGAETATLEISDNASGGSQSVKLSGTGTAPGAVLNPTSLAFGNQPQGVTSNPLNVKLTNGGNGSLNIKGFSFTGTNRTDFAQTNDCPGSLGAGAACTIFVTFTPSTETGETATLNVADDATGSPQTAGLSGTGVAAGPNPSLQPASLAFGGWAVATKSTPQTATLTNSGNTALSVTSIAIGGTNAGDFHESNNCGSSVAAGAKCTVTVTFTPSATGNRTGSLIVSDNGGTGSQSASLSGTGVHGATVAPSSLVFAPRAVGTTSGVQTFTLTNNQADAINIWTVSITGADRADFTQTSTWCDVLNPGAKCTFSVTFTPTGKGSRTATVKITDSADNSPQSVSLIGTGK